MERELGGKDDEGCDSSKRKQDGGVAKKTKRKGKRLKMPKQKLDVITEDESETDSDDVTSTENDVVEATRATPMHIALDEDTLRNLLDLTSLENKGIRVKIVTRDFQAMTSHAQQATPTLHNRKDKAKDELKQRTKDRKRLYRL